MFRMHGRSRGSVFAAGRRLPFGAGTVSRVRRVAVAQGSVLMGALVFAGSGIGARSSQTVLSRTLHGDPPTVAMTTHESIGSVVQRPTDGGPYGYAAADCSGYSNPCYRLSRPHVVVHWVAKGVDAPPLNDDDRNGIPDYVEEVASAAETSLTYYATHGFIAPRPDNAGSDSKPDIYIKHFKRTQGLYGITFPWTRAEGGTFVIIGNDLDRDPTKVVGGLKTTVAHELFHVVQFAYVPNGEIPDWVAEGTASAMSIEVFPQTSDTVNRDYLDLWLRETWRPLYDTRFACDHCYGGSLWWRFVYSLDGNVLSSYLGRLYGYQKVGVALGLGTQPLAEILQKKRYGGLFDVFTAFSRAVYKAGLITQPTYTLHASARPGVVVQTSVQTVAGLSAHYVTVTVPANARWLMLQTLTGGGPLPDVALVVGGPNGRTIKPKTATAKGTRKALFSIGFRSAEERKHVTLIVTSGRQLGARYLVRYVWS